MRAVTVIGVLLLAGCVAPGAGVEPSSMAPADWASIGASLFVEHDHSDRTQHEDLAHGLTVAAAGTLSDDGLSLGEYSEADAANGIVAVTSSVSAGGTFVLLDAAALPEIKVLSATWDPDAYGDVKLDPVKPLLYHAHPGNAIGFTIWDIADPAAPVKVGEARGPGCHMLHPQLVDGLTWVWCVGLPTTTLYRVAELPGGRYAGVVTGFAAPQSDIEIARYQDYYAKLTPLGPAGLLGSHDMTAQDDPLTGAPVLAVANELQGIRIFDVSTPFAPVEIGHWRGEGLDAPMERVHTVVLHAIGERRIAFAATETFTDAPSHF